MTGRFLGSFSSCTFRTTALSANQKKRTRRSGSRRYWPCCCGWHQEGAVGACRGRNHSLFPALVEHEDSTCNSHKKPPATGSTRSSATRTRRQKLNRRSTPLSQFTEPATWRSTVFATAYFYTPTPEDVERISIGIPDIAAKFDSLTQGVLTRYFPPDLISDVLQPNAR